VGERWKRKGTSNKRRNRPEGGEEKSSGDLGSRFIEKRGGETSQITCQVANLNGGEKEKEPSCRRKKFKEGGERGGQCWQERLEIKK